MATVTHDGQSFMIDSRRIWLVAGQMDYGRIPAEAWADRIHAAKLAGFNAIATSIPWALHEPRPGQFDFKGEHDLRRFVQLIHQAGMLCILRPGPYIGAGWDMGGIPDWVARKTDIKLRAASAPFLEAASRYITAVAEQVRDLQVTSPG
ncbi:MAG: beta-galactosidase, partial [Maioricimonas sp. JB049]